MSATRTVSVVNPIFWIDEWPRGFRQAPFDLEFRRITLVMGPNGVGKSTLLQAFDAEPGAVVLSTPENGMHPTTQASFASSLYDDFRPSRSARCAVKTHSNVFLLTMLLAVLERHLEPQDLIAYWLSRDTNNRSIVTPITYDERACPTGLNLPPEAFTTANRLSQMIANARMVR